MIDPYAMPRDSAVDATILAEERLATGKLRAFDGFEVAVPGTEKPLHREVLRAGRAIGVIAVDLRRDSLVMLRQFRLAAHLQTGKGELVEFVAGRLEAGEEPLTAAMRETREEIGLAITNPVEIFRFMPTPGATDEYATMYVAAVDSSAVPPSAGLASENETTQPFVVRIDDALEALQRNSVVNGYTLLGLQWLALNRARLGDLLEADERD
jgi:ADP-ribose pyrophosphatase